MGIISTIRELIENRKQKKEMKLLEDRTTQELTKFIDDFEQAETIEDVDKRLETQMSLIKTLEYYVKHGYIDLGGNQEEKDNNAILIVERYFKSTESKCKEQVCKAVNSVRLNYIADDLAAALMKKPIDVIKIENLLMNYIKLSKESEKNNNFLENYSEKEKQDMLISIVQKHHPRLRNSIYTSNYIDLYGELYKANK